MPQANFLHQCDGIPEVIEDGVTGFLVEPGDVNGLAEQVAHLVADPVMRARVGAAGQARVEEEFTERSVREFEKLLVQFASRQGN